MKKMKDLFSFLLLVLLIVSCNQTEVVDTNVELPKNVPNVVTTSQTGPIVVGYFPSWSESYPSGGKSPLRNIPEQVTHVFLSFAKPNLRYVKGSYDLTNTGVQVPYDGNTLKVTVDSLKAKNVKVILSIGGETYWATTDSYNIDYNQIADFVRDFGFGGVDWDFEPNGSFADIGTPTLVQQFITMITNTRTVLPRSEGFEIACAPAGCGALGGTVNDDATSPYSFAKRATVTGDDVSHTYDATNANGYTISLYGFASTGHMIPVFKAVGSMIDFVAFQGYNVGSASKREVMYDSYAYYANLYGFRVVFGMHVPQEPWGPYYTYTLQKVLDYANYVANGGTQNRQGKGDGVMYWQLLLRSSVDPTIDGIAYAKAAYDILLAANPITYPVISIVSPSNNGYIVQGTDVSVTTNTKRVTNALFYIDNTLLATVTAAPWSYVIKNLSLGVHVLKVTGINTATNEQADQTISFKVIDKNSVENIPPWSSTTTYATSGTQVLYNNTVYQNAWWTQGDTPGTSSVWVFVRNGPVTTGL